MTKILWGPNFILFCSIHDSVKAFLIIGGHLRGLFKPINFKYYDIAHLVYTGNTDARFEELTPCSYRDMLRQNIKKNFQLPVINYSNKCPSSIPY